MAIAVQSAYYVPALGLRAWLCIASFACAVAAAHDAYLSAFQGAAMERETESGTGTGQDVAVLPEWQAFAREFPQWYVWRGVAGQYYARVPRTSPPRVVRARNTEDLRREIARVEMGHLAGQARSRFRDYCA
jgi:hypothetical protein